MGKSPVERLKTLLGKLDLVRRSKQRGSEISDDAKPLSHKFVGQVEKTFKNLPKPLEWRSFYIHDLPLLLSTCKEVQDTSIQHNLNKSQIKALAKLKKVSENKFKRFANLEPSAPKVGPQLGMADMQKKKIIGVTSRYVIISEKKQEVCYAIYRMGSG